MCKSQYFYIVRCSTMQGMKRQWITIGVCVVILLILFLATNPNSILPIFLIAPFILLFAILFLLILFVSKMMNLPQSRRIRIAVIGTSIPVLLLILQSIDQLTIRDVLTAASLFLISYFYISRSTVNN
jgi:hypothetical protein